MNQARGGFNPAQYKAVTRDQWNTSGAGYSAWGGTLRNLIQPAAERVMDMAGITSGSRVLELAAGSGEFTLMLAAKVGPRGSVLATDLAPDILSFAAQKAQAAGFRNVETREMDGEQLEVPAASFDAVVSSLGLMFFPDPLHSLVAQRQALRPGGSVGAVVISAPQKNPFFSIPAQVIRERAGLPAPQPGMPGPFALGAPGAMEALFAKAGLKDVVSEAVGGQVELPSVAEHLRFLQDAFAALHMMMSALSEQDKQAAWKAVEEALTPFGGPEGFRCPTELIACVGHR